MARKNKLDLGMAERHYKHIKTNEDWYPTMTPYMKSPNPSPIFNNTLPCPAVTVCFNEDGPNMLDYRISVWGADDFGLEKDKLTRLQALQLFNQITNFTTQRELKDLGFEPV